MNANQMGLFDDLPDLPEGFRYSPNLITPSAETDLLNNLQTLSFHDFELRGFRGHRRIVTFGVKSPGEPLQAGDLPSFLLPLREKAAHFAGLSPFALKHVLITEYRPGAGIGWHRDKGYFKDIIGVSLASSCQFRFRQREGSGWIRRSVMLEPRSVYLLRNSARSSWEHSIPGVERLRYSITFRSMSGLSSPSRSYEK